MPTPARTTAASLRVFLKSMIDYAGLFPPASLDMMTAVNKYSGYLASEENWALGRFVLPVAGLDEFLNAQENVATDPWRLSGIVSADVESELEAVDEFNRKALGAMIHSVELRISSASEIEFARRHRPADTEIFFEITPQQAAELLPVIRGDRVKLRTGGVTQEAFPAVGQIADFLAQCAELRVPFKATAGLHHPMLCVRPLTYEPNAREGKMHGFLNLFTAAAIAWTAVTANRPIPRRSLATCLIDAERANWHFGDDAMVWSGDDEPVRIDLDAIRAMRSQFALSFGSCSFEEPFQDMHELDLL